MTELSALVRFVHLVAAVLLVGSFGFLLLVALPATKRANLTSDEFSLGIHRHIVIWSLFAISLTALFGLWMQIVTVSNPAAQIIFEPAAMVSVLTETQYGKVWLMRMVVVMVLAALQFGSETKRIKSDSVLYFAGGMIVSACLLTSLALSGHAAAGEGLGLFAHLSADALHLLASGLWLGALVPLFVFLRNSCRINATTDLAITQSATKRFSLLGLICVASLMVTGSYNAWILVGGFAALFGTPYGKLLLVKLGLLLPLLVVAAANLLRLKPSIVGAAERSQIASAAAKLRRNVIIEACIGFIILFIVGSMGVTPPARHVQPDWPFSFRWNWSSLDKAPKARAEFERGLIWASIGGIAIIAALTRRRRRLVSAAVAVGVLAYAVHTIHSAILIDAYPATYKRPAVTYNAISVANGKLLYQDSGCITCHGAMGHGDGEAADELNPKPVDLTAPHANTHTAGDLFWWLSHGVKPTSAMPGYNASLSEEERWDLINFMRALSSGERARNLAPVIDAQPWLVAPDFTYGTNNGQMRTLKDLRGSKIVLLIVLNVNDTEERLKQIAGALPQLQPAGVEIIVVPNLIDQLNVADKLPGLIVNEGIREITETYKLFARSFADETVPAATPHVEFLIDKQGYIRARWLPAENGAWQKVELPWKQVELLRNEKPSAPAPDDHVH